ncbi:hypothetical protein [Embleya sp. NPDC001921]
MSSTPGFAYAFADPSLFPSLYARMPNEIHDALRLYRLPDTEPVVDWLCAQVREDRELALALAESALAVRSDAVGMRIIRVLTGLDDPTIAVTLYRNTTRQPRPFRDTGYSARDTVLSAVFSAVRHPSDPAWHAADGLVSMLLQESPRDPLDFLPLLTAPFARLAAVAHEHLGPAFTASDDAPASPAPASASIPTPTAAELLLALRTGDSGASAAQVDWSAITAAHRRHPLPAHALATLAQHRDCPAELLTDHYRADPRSLPDTSPLPLDALDIRHPQRYGADLRSQTIRRGLRRGWFPIERLLHETGPALEVLTAIGCEDVPEPHIVAALAELVTPLGADPAAWIHLYTRLPRFRGPCTALVADAVGRVRTDPPPAWPRQTRAEIPGRPPEGARAALTVLLSAAGEDATIPLVPHLDPRAVQDLLRYARLGTKARDALLAAHEDAAVWWAAAAPTGADRDLLLDLDEPEINALLFQYGSLPAAERRRILAGRPRSADRHNEIPVADRLVDTVLSGYELVDVRERLLDCVYSGDATLVRILLGRAKVYTEVARLRLLARLWERQGPTAVEALLDETDFPRRRSAKHPLPPQTLDTAREALARPDGLAYLQDKLADALTPEAVAGYLIGKGGAAVGDRIERVTEEIGPIPWAAVARRHTDKPLDPAALEALAEHDDCPTELLRALIHRSIDDLPWRLRGTLRDRLDAAELAAEARPARAALPLVPAEDVRPLITAPLGDSVESWAVAARLLPDFPGSLTELVHTAAAITASPGINERPATAADALPTPNRSPTTARHTAFTPSPAGSTRPGASAKTSIPR